MNGSGTRKVEDQTDWQSNAHQTSCCYPLDHDGQLSPEDHRPLNHMGTLETHGLETGIQEIDHHKKKVEATRLLQSCYGKMLTYNHPLSWQKK